MDSRGCAFHLLLSPCQPGLVSNGKSHLVIDSSDVARRVVESNLRVVWRGSQWVNLSVCIHVCVYMCKKWWNCGWRRDNITQFNTEIIALFSILEMRLLMDEEENSRISQLLL